MTSPVQAHSKAIWRDRGAAAAVPTSSALFWRADGSDVRLLAARPEDFVFRDPIGDGHYRFLSVTPTYLAADGSGGLVVNQVGPMGVTLTDVPADLLFDVAGSLCLVAQCADRLDAVQTGADIAIY